MSMMRASGTREYQQSSIRRGEKESGRSWANLYVNGALACKQLAWQRRQRVEAGSEGAGCVDHFGRAGIYPRQQLRGRAGFSKRPTSKDLIFITIWRTTMGSSKDPIRFSASLFCHSRSNSSSLAANVFTVLEYLLAASAYDSLKLRSTPFIHTGGPIRLLDSPCPLAKHQLIDQARKF